MKDAGAFTNTPWSLCATQGRDFQAFVLMKNNQILYGVQTMKLAVKNINTSECGCIRCFRPAGANYRRLPVIYEAPGHINRIYTYTSYSYILRHYGGHSVGINHGFQRPSHMLYRFGCAANSQSAGRLIYWSFEIKRTR